MIWDIILCFLLISLALLNLIHIYTIIHNFKLKFTKKFIVLFFISSILATLINFYKVLAIKSLFTLFSLCLIIKLCYKFKLKKVFIYALFIWSVGMLLDVFCSIIFSLLIQFLPVTIFEKYNLFIIYGLTIILQIMYNLLARTSRFKKISYNFTNIIDRIKFSYIFHFIIVILIFLLGIFTLMFVYDVRLVLFMFAVFIILFVLEIKAIYYQYAWKDCLETNKNLIENNKFYVEMNIEVRKFKHNLTSKLDGIKSYGSVKANKLIDEVIKECKLLSSTNKEIEKLPLGINGLICRKLLQKQNRELNVLIENNIKYDLFDILKARNYNRLCEALGLALDNAIEASLSSKEKVLMITLEQEKDYITLSILNTFSDLINIDKLGSLNYTTKGNGNGIGLFSILFNKQLQTKVKVKNNMFEVFIKVKIGNLKTKLS